MEWISFKDRLPPRADDSTGWSVRVLLYNPQGDYNGIFTSPIILSLGGGNATHWMPLPEPPTK